MKKFISTFIITLIVTTVFSQDGTGTTCYMKYAKVFEKRGAYQVNDSIYDDIIITIRKGTLADCFYGKVNVKNGNIDIHNIYLKFEDATYEKLDLKFKYDAKLIEIVNGMSNVILTEDEELVNILFVKKIKPKKKKYATAADPDFDF